LKTWYCPTLPQCSEEGAVFGDCILVTLNANGDDANDADVVSIETVNILYIVYVA